MTKRAKRTKIYKAVVTITEIEHDPVYGDIYRAKLDGCRNVLPTAPADMTLAQAAAYIVKVRSTVDIWNRLDKVDVNGDPDPAKIELVINFQFLTVTGEES